MTGAMREVAGATMNIWKLAAKFFRSQFLLWREAYNEIADKYMIAEAYSGGNPDAVFVVLCGQKGFKDVQMSAMQNKDNS